MYNQTNEHENETEQYSEDHSKSGYNDTFFRMFRLAKYQLPSGFIREVNITKSYKIYLNGSNKNADSATSDVLTYHLPHLAEILANMKIT